MGRGKGVRVECVPCAPFGLRNVLSCTGHKVRSLPASVTQSMNSLAAWAISLRRYGLHAPAVRAVQA